MAENPLEFFPNFPTTLGKGVYAADKSSSAKSKSRNCRKKTKAHPALLPGMFTVFCEHEICMGFCLMTEVESQRTPFDIFLNRFSQYLSEMTIMYDNCCNLHEFVLN